MKSLLCLLLIFSAGAFAAEENQFRPLKDVRNQIVFKPLSDEDKELIISYTRTLFSKVYVNLEHKMSIYPTNPLADLKIIEDRYHEMDEVEFHQRMLAIYTSVRDFHVNYNLPKPYACYSSLTGFSLQKMKANKIIVTSVNLNLKNLSPDLHKLTPGDELVSYQNTSPLSYIKSRSAAVGASTPDAVIVQGVFDLYFRSYYGSILQKDNEITASFKKPNGEEYSVVAPWIARFNPDCLKEKTEEKVQSGKTDENLREVKLKERKKFFLNWKNKFITFFKNKLPLVKKKFLNSDTTLVDLSTPHTTKHPNLFWKVIPYQGQNFGYLKLDSFDAPEGTNAAVAEVKKVLTQNLADTSALVIDLRGNYGGQISFAEKMAALFGAMPVKNIPFYVRANDFMSFMFKDDPSWLKMMLPQGDNNTLVGPGNLTTISDLSRVSQSYFGKVVLLTNSECFSSCDLFSAVMKDYARVKIYGTDHSTFGGGANVWATGYMKSAFESIDMPVPPQNISMRVTARHAHRMVDNSLIEDRGVATDIVLDEEADDLLSQNSTVVAKIYNDFLKDPALKKSSDTFVEFDQKSIQVHGDTVVNLKASVGNVDYISVFKNKKFVQRFEKDAQDNIAVTLDSKNTPYGTEPVEIYGFDRDSSTRFPVLRTSLLLETLPAFKKLQDLNIIGDAVTTTYPRNPDCGWTKSANALLLEGYCPETSTEATLSIELPKTETILSFDLVMDTEPDFDFFEIVAIVDGVETKLMEPVSQPQNESFHISLAAFAGKKIDLKFKVISDEAFSGKGGSISNIQIQ